MLIFICYASADSDTARHLAVALRSQRVGGSRLRVFLAESTVRPSTDFVADIETAIRNCHLFLFLISRASVAPGRFTLTELEWIEKRWPTPHGRVVGVRVDDTPYEAIPPYVRNGALYTPRGNLEAEVRGVVRELLRKRLRPRLAVLAGVALVAAFGLAWTLSHDGQDPDQSGNPPIATAPPPEKTITVPESATGKDADTEQPAAKQGTTHSTTRGTTSGSGGTTTSPGGTITGPAPANGLLRLWVPETYTGPVILNGTDTVDVEHGLNEIEIEPGSVTVYAPACRRAQSVDVPARDRIPPVTLC